MVKKKGKFRILPLSSKRNPLFSVTYLKGKYNVFLETQDLDLGNYSRKELLSIGFKKTQLDKVKKQGTQNFIKVN